jgi:hypothetical protein
LIILVIGWLFLDAFYWNVITTVNLIKRTEIVFFIAILLSWIVCFLAGIHPARERFSCSPEDELWKGLPVSPLVRALAGVTAMFLLVLPLHLFLYLPALFVYLRFMPHDARWVAGAAAGVFLVPVAPVMLSVAVALALRRFPRFSRRGLAVEIVFVILVVGLLALGQTTLQSALVKASQGDGLIFPVKLSFFLGDVARTVPPADWLASVFRPGEEPLNFMGGFLFCLVLSVPVVAWAARSMGRAAAATPLPPPLEARLRQNTHARGMGMTPRRLMAALVLREGKLLFAQSSLVFEATLRLLILPAFLILYLAIGSKDFTTIVVSVITSSPLFTIIAVCLLFFLFDISFLAATGLSREGRIAALSISLPVDGGVQAKAKVLFLLLLSLPPAILTLTLIYVLFPVPLETLVCAVPGLAAYLLFSITIGLLFDYRRPVLQTSRPVFRQNANTVMTLAVETALLSLLGVLCGGALLVGVSPLAAAFLCVQVLILIDLVILPRLFRYAARRHRQGWEV